MIEYKTISCTDVCQSDWTEASVIAFPSFEQYKRVTFVMETELTSKKINV